MQRMLISVSELSMQLGISKPKAYELIKQKGFPVLNIGKRKLIPIKELELWVSNNSKAK